MYLCMYVCICIHQSRPNIYASNISHTLREIKPTIISNIYF